LSSVSGVSSKATVISVVRVPLAIVFVGVLAVSAAIIPQYFIRESLGAEKLAEVSYGEILPWVVSILLLAMTVGPAVWLYGQQKRPKQSPTRLIMSIFALVGLGLVIVTTVGGVSIMRYGHSTQVLQDNLGPMFWISAVTALALQLFALFLLYTASVRVYRMFV
jgi:hypothetical protein